jgi:hypothetical protein
MLAKMEAWLEEIRACLEKMEARIQTGQEAMEAES